MPSFYLDSSALAKGFKTEQGTPVIDQLLQHPAPGDGFYTSFVSYLEVTSVVSRLAKSGNITGHQASFLYSRLRADVRTNKFTLWPVTVGMLASAVAECQSYGLKSLDAIHLASAKSVRSNQSVDLVMVSSDKRLLDAAKSSGFRTLDPVWGNASEILQQIRRSNPS